MVHLAKLPSFPETKTICRLHLLRVGRPCSTSAIKKTPVCHQCTQPLGRDALGAQEVSPLAWASSPSPVHAGSFSGCGDRLAIARPRARSPACARSPPSGAAGSGPRGTGWGVGAGGTSGRAAVTGKRAPAGSAESTPRAASRSLRQYRPVADSPQPPRPSSALGSQSSSRGRRAKVPGALVELVLNFLSLWRQY